MSDGVLGTLGVGAMLAFIAGASIYLRLTKGHPDVDEDALRRVRRGLDVNRRSDPELHDDGPPGR